MPKSTNSPNDILTAEQAAAIAGVHRNTVLDWIKRKILPARRKGFGISSAYMIRRDHLMSVLASRDGNADVDNKK